MSAVERLGAAIHAHTGGWTNTTHEQSAEIAQEIARATLAHDSTLADALELGLAWEELEASRNGVALSRQRNKAEPTGWRWTARVLGSPPLHAGVMASSTVSALQALRNLIDRLRAQP